MNTGWNSNCEGVNLLADYTELLSTIKQAAVEAVEADKPVNVCYGKVTSASPLKILVDQKMTLGEGQLVLTRNVTDFSTSITVHASGGWTTEKETQLHYHVVPDGLSEEQDPKHDHDLEGRKTILVHNALTVGEQVILIRQQEGQKYIVIDRIGG
jgi:hypothetical protein